MSQGGTTQSLVVIDDSPLVLDVVSTILREKGYDVITLTSPKEYEVTEVIMRARPALVLVDVEMPDGRGDDLVSLLRGYGFLGDTKVLLFSQRPVMELALLTQTSGADGYIRKTNDPAVLLREVAKHFEPAPAGDPHTSG